MKLAKLIVVTLMLMLAVFGITACGETNDPPARVTCISIDIDKSTIPAEGFNLENFNVEDLLDIKVDLTYANGEVKSINLTREMLDQNQLELMPKEEGYEGNYDLTVTHLGQTCNLQIKVFSAHTHVMGEWQIVHSATCTEEGLKERTCNCGYKQEDKIEPLEHNFADTFTTDKNPTCTEDGSKSRHCSRCSEVTDVTSLKSMGTEHDYGEWETEFSATCTTQGCRRQVCSICHDTKIEYLSALGHRIDDATGECTNGCGLTKDNDINYSLTWSDGEGDYELLAENGEFTFTVSNTPEPQRGVEEFVGLVCRIDEQVVLLVCEHTIDGEQLPTGEILLSYTDNQLRLVGELINLDADFRSIPKEALTGCWTGTYGEDNYIKIQFFDNGTAKIVFQNTYLLGDVTYTTDSHSVTISHTFGGKTETYKYDYDFQNARFTANGASGGLEKFNKNPVGFWVYENYEIEIKESAEGGYEYAITRWDTYDRERGLSIGVNWICDEGKITIDEDGSYHLNRPDGPLSGDYNIFSYALRWDGFDLVGGKDYSKFHREIKLSQHEYVIRPVLRGNYEWTEVDGTSRSIHFYSDNTFEYRISWIEMQKVSEEYYGNIEHDKDGEIILNVTKKTLRYYPIKERETNLDSPYTELKYQDGDLYFGDYCLNTADSNLTKVEWRDSVSGNWYAVTIVRATNKWYLRIETESDNNLYERIFYQGTFNEQWEFTLNERLVCDYEKKESISHSPETINGNHTPQESITINGHIIDLKEYANTDGKPLGKWYANLLDYDVYMEFEEYYVNVSVTSKLDNNYHDGYYNGKTSTARFAYEMNDYGYFTLSKVSESKYYTYVEWCTDFIMRHEIVYRNGKLYIQREYDTYDQYLATVNTLPCEYITDITEASGIYVCEKYSSVITLTIDKGYFAVDVKGAISERSFRGRHYVTDKNETLKFYMAVRNPDLRNYFFDGEMSVAEDGSILVGNERFGYLRFVKIEPPTSSPFSTPQYGGWADDTTTHNYQINDDGTFWFREEKYYTNPLAGLTKSITTYNGYVFTDGTDAIFRITKVIKSNVYKYSAYGDMAFVRVKKEGVALIEGRYDGFSWTVGATTVGDIRIAYGIDEIITYETFMEGENYTYPQLTTISDRLKCMQNTFEYKKLCDNHAEYYSGTFVIEGNNIVYTATQMTVNDETTQINLVFNGVLTDETYSIGDSVFRFDGIKNIRKGTLTAGTFTCRAGKDNCALFTLVIEEDGEYSLTRTYGDSTSTVSGSVAVKYENKLIFTQTAQSGDGKGVEILRAVLFSREAYNLCIDGVVKINGKTFAIVTTE